jgi:hypothetical protein
MFKIKKHCAGATGLLALWLMLTGCAPSYPATSLADSAKHEIERDWGVVIDRAVLRDGHLGVIYRTDDLWEPGGKLRTEKHREVENVNRTLERLVVSSDASVTKISVMATATASIMGIYFARDFETIRKKRTGNVAWQDVIDSDEIKAVPSWRWVAFDEPFTFYRVAGDEQIRTLVTDIFKTQYNLDVEVTANDAAVGVMTRVSKMWNGQELDPAVDSRLKAMLNITGQALLMSDRPATRVVATVMGQDSTENLHRTAQLENIKARIEGRLSQEEESALIVQTRTPYYEWGEFGKVAILDMAEFTAKVQQDIRAQTKLDTKLHRRGEALVVDTTFTRGIPAELNGETPGERLQSIIRLTERQYAIADLVAPQIIYRLSTTEAVEANCFTRDTAALQALWGAGPEVGRYFDDLTHDRGEACYEQV